MMHQLHFEGVPAPDPEYPFAAGHRGVETSIEAAQAINPKLGRLQALCFDAIKAVGEVGLTAEELAAKLNIPRGSVQPRTTELQEFKRIVDSKQRRKNESGRRAIVWTVSSEGSTNG